jgi:hypothetical protein
MKLQSFVESQSKPSAPKKGDSERSLISLAEFPVVLLVSLGLAFLLYQGSLRFGFVLDDYYHVDYLNRFLAGDWSTLLAKLHGNWSGDTDGLTSYRPLISIALAALYWIGQGSTIPFRYADISLLAMAGVSVYYLIRFIVPTKNVAIAALTSAGAMALYITCPLHIESAVTATLMGDILVSLFCALSLIGYYAYKESGQLWKLFASLFSFALALLVKEHAVTLPVIVTVSSLLRIGNQRESKSRIPVEAWYWLVLGLYGGARVAFLGTLVGGYGGGFGIRGLIRQVIGACDLATLKKVFYPTNEHFQFPTELSVCLSACYLVLAARAVFVLRNSARLFAFLFLCLWTIISLAPSFQIWHVYPNLVGGRLFFMSSAPFCMLLALLGAGETNLAVPLYNRILTAIGVLSLAVTCYIWSVYLGIDLKPYTVANKQMLTASLDLEKYDISTKGHIYVLNLPQDYCGAPMLGKALFFKIFCQPPTTPMDISKKFICLTNPAPGAHEFIYVRPLFETLQKDSAANYLVWSQVDGTFVPWTKPTGAKSIQLDLTKPDPTLQESKQGMDSLYTARTPIDALAAAVAVVDVGDSFAKDSPLQFFWKAKMQKKSTEANNNDSEQNKSIAPDIWQSGKAIFDLQKYPEWTYAVSISEFGISSPDQALKPRSFSLVESNKIKPILSLTSNSHESGAPYQYGVVNVGKEDDLTLDFDASQIEGANGIQIQVPYKSPCFLDATQSTPGGGQKVKEFAGTKSSYVLHADEIRRLFPKLPNKIGQLRVQATDSKGQALGLPSEPATFYLAKP